MDSLKKINTALLSFGMSGKVFHAPFLHLHSGFQLLGSWERSKKLIEKEYSSVKSYESLEAILNDDQVDLVVVNTPTHTHFEYAAKSLEAGKHVIVEKAFTATSQEAQELQKLAQSKQLKISIFQNRRWDSDFKTVKEVVQKGLLGDIVEATFSYPRYTPELSPKAHKETPNGGAGVIKNLGAHTIDQAIYLFGMPKQVFADLAMTRPGSLVEDYCDILLLYNKMRVHIKAGYFFREPEPSYIIHGTKGSFLKTRADVQEDQLQSGTMPSDTSYGIEPIDQEGLLHSEIEGKLVREKIRTHHGNYMDYYDGIYEAIVNDKIEPVTAQDGVNSMKIIDAAFESAEKGKLVNISPPLK